MTIFHLPDLGEGLPDAEIVSWHVSPGESVDVDQLLVSVETAKAVVEVPAPFSGIVHKLYAQEGDVVPTGAPLIEFTDSATREPAAEQRLLGQAASESTLGGEAAAPSATIAAGGETAADRSTVVGTVPTGGSVVEETAIIRRHRRTDKRIKATPSVRSEARRLGIDLALVKPSGRNGQVTMADLAGYSGNVQLADASRPNDDTGRGQRETLRGPRRVMAQSMSIAHRDVALCTLFDDADIDAWLEKENFTPRLLRAVAAGAQAEPRLNGFYDAEKTGHTIESRVDVALAVDTEEGLIVPVIRAVQTKSLEELRADVAGIKQATLNRTVAPEDMQNYTITLSNFGTLCGRYATPMVVPPSVAILGTGKLQHDVVAVMGAIEVHHRIPLSLSFDHRCITGGDACRFLSAVIKDLEKPE